MSIGTTLSLVRTYASIDGRKASEGTALTIPIRLEVTTSGPPDELVPLSKCGLERAAAARAVREGRLPATKQGRSIYVRRSDVLRLVESDPVKPPPPRSARAKEKPPPDEYARVVARARRRA